ncbi:MAG: methylmalonyl Co-A mutase-associated GTPase MeaB [Bacteroidia bacterium]
MESEIFNNLINGDRLALAKAITIIESRNPIHQKQTDELIQMALKLNKTSLRIGITGVPGVGKSTFINSFGSWLVNEKQKKVCVLAIDPSSHKNHGSILGDKTRMETLSMMENVFIRPSPTGGNLGGVARKTRETILLCEAAGYDTILIETVGVGQSEYVADRVVDCLLLLLLPNAGDELQGIKRGIMELADIVILNKADITEPAILNQAVSDVTNAIHFLPNKFEGWNPQVLKNSLDNKDDSLKIWEQIETFIAFQKSKGYFYSKRNDQKTEWLNEAIKEKVETTFFNNSKIKEAIKDSMNGWLNGEKSLDEIAANLINNWKNQSPV